MITLSFFGAAGEVTGSCYLLQTDQASVLIDFGLHQGERDADDKNATLPPIEPGKLDAVILTHGHLDHCGRLPQLTKAGFAGGSSAPAPPSRSPRLFSGIRPMFRRRTPNRITGAGPGREALR